MALILTGYRKYFVVAGRNDALFAQSDNYFDPKERSFLRLSKDDPRDRSSLWRIPSINEADLHRQYFAIHGYENFLRRHADDSDRAFCKAAKEYADENGFDVALYQYVDDHILDHCYEWAVGHRLENFKLTFDNEEYIACTGDHSFRDWYSWARKRGEEEAEQERIFKEQRKQK